MIRRRVRVHGRVQGVWFRGATQATAQAAGVAGWVRNLSDGTIEAVFEGPPEGVAAILAFCRSGPRGARVDRLEESEETPEGIEGFRIR